MAISRAADIKDLVIEPHGWSRLRKVVRSGLKERLIEEIRLQKLARDTFARHEHVMSDYDWITSERPNYDQMPDLAGMRCEIEERFPERKLKRKRSDQGNAKKKRKRKRSKKRCTPLTKRQRGTKQAPPRSTRSSSPDGMATPECKRELFTPDSKSLKKTAMRLKQVPPRSTQSSPPAGLLVPTSKRGLFTPDSSSPKKKTRRLNQTAPRPTQSSQRDDMIQSTPQRNTSTPMSIVGPTTLVTRTGTLYPGWSVAPGFVPPPGSISVHISNDVHDNLHINRPVTRHVSSSNPDSENITDLNTNVNPDTNKNINVQVKCSNHESKSTRSLQRKISFYFTKTAKRTRQNSMVTHTHTHTHTHRTDFPPSPPTTHQHTPPLLTQANSQDLTRTTSKNVLRPVAARGCIVQLPGASAPVDSEYGYIATAEQLMRIKICQCEYREHGQCECPRGVCPTIGMHERYCRRLSALGTRAALAVRKAKCLDAQSRLRKTAWSDRLFSMG